MFAYKTLGGFPLPAESSCQPPSSAKVFTLKDLKNEKMKTKFINFYFPKTTETKKCNKKIKPNLDTANFPATKKREKGGGEEKRK